MPMQIYIAHSGASLQADPHNFASVDELRTWIEQSISMPAGCQILMTALGRNIKAQTLSNERELYLFDRRLLTVTSPPPPTITVPRVQTPSPFPDSLASETDLSAWRTLFKKRLLWSESVLSHAQVLATTITDTDTATSTIQRAVLVAFSNLETHSTGLQNSLGKLRDWADGVLVEQDKVLRDWEPSVTRLTRIPVHEELRKYALAADEGTHREVKVLSDFFDVKAVQIAAAEAEASMQKFERDVVELGRTIEDVVGQTTALKGEIQKARNAKSGDVGETLKMLLAEIDVVVRKVRTDYEYVLSLQGPKAISTASKRAYASTTEYLPGLVNTVTDIGRLLQQVVQQKNTTTALCTRHLQAIAHIQQTSAPINPQIAALDSAYQEEDQSFRLLSLITGFPSVYGSLLMECVRRREWSEKFSNDSKRVAEELALLKEEEEKRRKKWQRNVGEFLPFSLDDGAEVVRAELNTRGDFSGGLPKIAREDLEDFIKSIKNIEGMEAVVKEVAALAARLDEPLRRHPTKRVRGFKFGSVHEAGLGASSMFSGGSDEIRTLRADKDALTERIKGYESRVRKLEDLIHRGRQQSAGAYQSVGSPITQMPGTPLPGSSFPPPAMGHHDVPSSPISIRRISTEPADRPMPGRVVALEAELALEREMTARLQKEAALRLDTERELSTRITQAEDTKRDLVANLEALDQQHVVERKEFQREIDELRGRIEEAEEEMDRLEELRGGEEGRRRMAEERVGRLEDELEVVGGEVERLRGREEELEELVRAERGRLEEEEKRREETEDRLRGEREENSRLKETIRGLEEKMKGMKEVLDGAKKQNEGYTEKQESLATTMKSAHGRLSTDSPSEDLNALMSSIDNLIASAVTHKNDLSSQLEQEKARVNAVENAKRKLQVRFESRTMKAKDLTQRLYTCNVRSIQLLEALGYRVVRGEGEGVMQIVKVGRRESNSGGGSGGMAESILLGKSTNDLAASKNMSASKNFSLSKSGHLPVLLSQSADITVLYWMKDNDSEAESSAYSHYLSTTTLDLDAFAETILTRLRKADSDARTLMKQCRAYREKYYRARDEANEKIAFKSFKSGDLALFLPTRNSVTRPWAAFNVGAPHFFLKEEVGHKLGSRDWLLARIGRVEERVVDLSRSTAQLPPISAERASLNSSDGASMDDENPFELSDGLRWYLLDAVEEKPGAPTTPGLGSSTVAAANVDAKGSLRSRKPVTGAKKTLSQITTEHSRRSSSASGRGIVSRDGVPGEVVTAVREAIEGQGDTAAISIEGAVDKGDTRPGTAATVGGAVTAAGVEGS